MLLRDLSRALSRTLLGFFAASLLWGCAPSRPEYVLGARLPTIHDDPNEVPALPTRTVPSQAVAPAPLPPLAEATATANTADARALAPSAPSSVAAVAPAEFWTRLRSGFAVPPLPVETVAEFHRAYGTRPDFLARATQRGAPYLPHIAQQLVQRNMPADLALLPVIESAFEPRALSPAAAAGVWQFIPETGRRYGLQRNWLRDDRRDVFAATNAALDYLGDLYRMFGNWHLALAGYNCGEGCVARALSQARAAGAGQDFTSISRWLPAETRAYVPRFIAVRDVVYNAPAFGLTLPAVDSSPRVVRISIDRDADLASIARASGMPLPELLNLNAGALRQVVTQGQSIWMPEHRAARLASGLQVKDDGSLAIMQLKPSQARANERLAAFAARHNTTAEQLRDINGIAPSLHVIQSGTLFVPLQSGEQAVPIQVSAWPALRMQGEEAVAARSSSHAADRDRALLAAHPHWVESGWTPGRLRTLGGKPKR
ncbi:transglycosylase SLT domain-containing protein [Variovorax sp. VNK109]|uniref:transglycosylase SLT domain-containing protein n=1 Tax=Variovorax sp. VNK109 TaxID=3400919 RepID=UPI003C30671B